jgi:hypothetical protein
MSKFRINKRFSSFGEEEDNNSRNKDKRSNVITKQNNQEIKNTDNNFVKKNGNNRERNCSSFKNDRNRMEEDKIKESLSLENFPELISKPANNTSINYMSFSEKLQSEVINKKNEIDIDLDYKNLSPGWTLIKRNNSTNEITMNKRASLEVFCIEGLSDKNYVLDSLVELHTNRINEYIDMWGYEEWDHMFRFPDYDYNYFDKLDELYYQEIDNYESEYEEDYDECTTDYDKFSNYLI